MDAWKYDKVLGMSGRMGEALASVGSKGLLPTSTGRRRSRTYGPSANQNGLRWQMPRIRCT